MDIIVLNKEIDNEAERELGPLKYIAELTDTPMNKVINWLLLLIIFVFDPLAIALVVAANFAFDQIKDNEKPAWTVDLPEIEIVPEIETKVEENLESSEKNIIINKTKDEPKPTKNVTKWNRQKYKTSN